jgi:hypothetical protein
LVTKAEVAASVVETTKKRKTDEAREMERELESKTRQELEQLSEQEVEEFEVLLDGGQGEREWSVHARARRKRQKFESSRMEEERRRWNFLWELEESWPMANSNGNGIKLSCCNSNSSNGLNNGSKNSISSSISIEKRRREAGAIQRRTAAASIASCMASASTVRMASAIASAMASAVAFLTATRRKMAARRALASMTAKVKGWRGQDSSLMMMPPSVLRQKPTMTCR